MLLLMHFASSFLIGCLHHGNSQLELSCIEFTYLLQMACFRLAVMHLPQCEIPGAYQGILTKTFQANDFWYNSHLDFDSKISMQGGDSDSQILPLVQILTNSPFVVGSDSYVNIALWWGFWHLLKILTVNVCLLIGILIVNVGLWWDSDIHCCPLLSIQSYHLVRILTVNFPSGGDSDSQSCLIWGFW